MKRTAETMSYTVIFEILKGEGEKTLESIAETTGISMRTLRYGIKRLNDRQVLGAKLRANDMRRKIYFIRPEFREGPCPIQ